MNFQQFKILYHTSMPILHASLVIKQPLWTEPHSTVHVTTCKILKANISVRQLTRQKRIVIASLSSETRFPEDSPVCRFTERRAFISRKACLRREMPS